MNLSTWTSVERGRTARLARAIRVLPVLISQWCATRQVPQQHCPGIERETQGAVPCEEQRPDIAWHRVPDADWPWHPDGRPLIDVTRQVAPTNEEARDAA